MLIRDGAVLVRGAADVLEAIGRDRARPPEMRRRCRPDAARAAGRGGTARAAARLGASPLAEDQLIRT